MQRLLRYAGIAIRRGEGLVAGSLFLYFFLIICFQYATKSVRQSTYVYELGAETLPVVYILVAVCSYPVLVLYGRLADRFRRHHLIAATSIFVAASLVVFWWLFQLPGRWVQVVFYVWISIVYVLNVSQFWSYSNNVLDPRQAKRLFGFVGAGGLLGGIAGGQVAAVTSSIVDTRFSLIVAALILLGPPALIFFLQHRHPPDEARTGGVSVLSRLDEARGGFAIIRRSRQLSLIAVIMLLTIVVANVVDLQFNWAMDQATRELDESERRDILTGGYGNFYTVMGIAALAFQLLFTSRIHRLLGLGFAMRVLPVVMALGTTGLFLAATVLPGAMLNVCRLLKIGENGLRYSLDQATRELLFLPVPARQRLTAKAYIDVFVQRSAKAVAGVLLLPITFVEGLSPVDAGWLSLILIMFWLVTTVAVRREYVVSFRNGLKRQTVDASAPINVTDTTTLEILVQSLGSPDPRQVLHGLDMLDSHGRRRLVPPLLLYHDDAGVRRRTLTILAEAERRDAKPLIERSLGDEDPTVRAEAIRTLARILGEDARGMMLVRLHDRDPGVRAAAVACLANQGDEEMIRRATATLDDMLSDGSPGVRLEAAKAIGATRDPLFQHQLIQLLYDSEPCVAREGVRAVRERVQRDGFSPLYSPTLISLLSSRRLKHDVRDSLAALGEPVIPVLVHFMNDTDEQLWVRRALPKTIARVGSAAAADALVKSLETPTDPMLRRKIIEALGSVRAQERPLYGVARVRRAVRVEADEYLWGLSRLWALGMKGKCRLEGPLVRWEDGEYSPSLLELLLAEQMQSRLKNVFGLLALMYPPQHVWSAHRSLVSGKAALRNYALEYLSNTLTGEVRRNVFLMIDDVPVPEKLRAASRLPGIARTSRTGVLEEMLTRAEPGDEEACSLAVAALYTIHTDRVSLLYPRVERVLAENSDPFVKETAAWVARRMRSGVPS